MNVVFALLLAMGLSLQGGVRLAELAYREGRHGEAQRLFEAALERGGAAEGPLLYNIGNCAYRLGHHAEAVLHYRRALLRLPDDARVKDNLRLAEQELGVFREPDTSITSRLMAGLGGIPATALLWLSGALQAVGLCGLLLSRRGVAMRMTMAFVLLLGLAGGARVLWLRVSPPPPGGVVLQDEVAVRAEPHRRTGVVLVLRAGELVRVEEWSDRWARVTHPRGGGWALREHIGIVD